MAIKVVVLDAATLPPGVDFPPLDLDKYGWEQYPRLAEEEIAQRCWRADIVITLTTPVSASLLKEMAKIGLLICAGEACGGVDQQAARAQGVELLAFAQSDFSTVAGAQDFCDRVVAAIDHYVARCRAQEAEH